METLIKKRTKVVLKKILGNVNANYRDYLGKKFFETK